MEISPNELEDLRAKLDQMVAAGEITREQADQAIKEYTLQLEAGQAAGRLADEEKQREFEKQQQEAEKAKQEAEAGKDTK